MPIKILLADDHSIVRQGLRMFLNLDPELTVVGEAANGAEAVQLAEATAPDVILMDLLMPVMNGLEATAAIRGRLPNVAIIVLTSVLEDAAVSAVFRAGALGYLLKDTEADELRRAIKAAAAGQAQLSPQVAARLLMEAQAPESGEPFTDHESQVLRLTARGFSDQQIATELLVSEPAVRDTIRDILDKLRLANQAQAALLDFSNRLLDHPDPAALMNYLVQETQRLLHADACAVLLPDDRPGRLRFRAASGWRRDPVAAGLHMADEDDSGPGHAIRTRQPWQVRDLEADAPATSDADVWRAEGFRGHAVIPLLVESRTIGVLALDCRRPRWLTDDELGFLRLLANQAALVLEQARLQRAEAQQQDLEEDLAVARRIQLSLLPDGCPQIAGWEFAAAYQAARIVGGDLYDFIELPGAPPRLGLLIADVSGKGAAAALFMAHCRVIIRGAALSSAGPADTLSQANEQILLRNETSHFISAFYAVLDTASGRLTYANAGHNRPLWWRAATGAVEPLGSHGLVLGLAPALAVDERQVDLAPGDTVVLYTVGITEAINAHEELFDDERLTASLAAAGGRRPQAAVDAILAAVKAFSGDTPQADDYTLVALKRLPG